MAAICVAQACAVAATFGDTVYNNGGPADTNVPGGYEMTQWIEADDFTLADQTRIDSIKFWNLELAGRFQGSIHWRIYANTAQERPGQMLAEGELSVSHTPGRPVSPPYQEWINTFSITPVTLPAGTYWLGLHNGPLANNTIQFVFWETNGQTGARPAHQNAGPNFDDGDWESVAVPGRPTELAFQLNGFFVPRATAIVRNNGAPRFSFTTRSGYTYRVEYEDGLNPPSWQTVPGAEMINGTGGVVEVPDPNGSNRPRRFYRAVVL